MIRSSADTAASHDEKTTAFVVQAVDDLKVAWSADLEMFSQAECDQRIANLIAAVRAESQPAWQPIATAPKDGTVVLITVNVSPFGWITGYAAWHNIERIGGAWVAKGFGLFGELGLSNPSHWMPLPDPPRAGTVDELSRASATSSASAAQK